MNTPITLTDPSLCRALANDPKFVAEELFIAPSNGHKFKPGETRELIGLEDFAEFNGQKVLITSIRENGAAGKAYYIKGAINKYLNWVYEYRLI